MTDAPPSIITRSTEWKVAHHLPFAVAVCRSGNGLIGSTISRSDPPFFST
jgi:hypothetical protein